MTLEDLEEILPKKKRIFLMVSNILIAGTIVLDLFFITNIISFPLETFTLYNLIILGIALYGYKIKKQVNKELRERKKEETKTTTD